MVGEPGEAVGMMVINVGAGDIVGDDGNDDGGGVGREVSEGRVCEGRVCGSYGFGFGFVAYFSRTAMITF